MEKTDNWENRHTGMVCSTCIYFVPKKGRGMVGNELRREFGRCRKHAPVVQQGWPAMYGTDWCGDHKLDENRI